MRARAVLPGTTHVTVLGILRFNAGLLAPDMAAAAELAGRATITSV